MTKYNHFMALTHPFNATIMVETFLNNIYKLHGMPNRILSDRDSIILMVKRKGVFLCLSSACYPQTDGQTDVVN